MRKRTVILDLSHTLIKGSGLEILLEVMLEKRKEFGGKGFWGILFSGAYYLSGVKLGIDYLTKKGSEILSNSLGQVLSEKSVEQAIKDKIKERINPDIAYYALRFREIYIASLEPIDVAKISAKALAEWYEDRKIDHPPIHAYGSLRNRPLNSDKYNRLVELLGKDIVIIDDSKRYYKNMLNIIEIYHPEEISKIFGKEKATFYKSYIDRP